MKGCRPYSIDEYEALKRVANACEKCMLTLGVRTGFRISELLSLDVEDVSGDWVSLKKKNTKGKVEGRVVPMHPEAKAAVMEYVGERKEGPLFLGKRDRKRIGRITAWKILCELHTRASIREEGLGTHSMRKTFAQNLYLLLNKDLVKLQSAMGHKNIDSTAKYISFCQEDIWNAIRNSK